MSQRLLGHALVAALHQGFPERVPRKRRLDQHLARALGAPRAPGDLDDGLCHALGAPKVGAEQSLVRVQDAHQRQVREVVPFRQHLRADQDVRFALPREIERVDHGAALLRAVAVDTHDVRGREAPAQRILQPFGAFAQRPDDLAALAALLVERPRVAAMMAAQLPLLCMHRQARVAAVALGDVAATRTDQCGREPAAVEEHEDLAAGVDVQIKLN